MKFMIIVKASENSEAGVMPSKQLLEDMGKFNQEMMDAGIWVDAAGLKASSKGARVVFQGGKRSVVHGPFAETNELIAGFWIVNVASLDEAVEWMLRVPFPHPGEDTNIEIRPFFEMEDFA